MAKKTNQYHPQIVFHPGETLVEKIEELGMSVKEFAIRSNKPEKTVIAILNKKSSITPNMAVQFENVLKIPAHFWLNMQRNYDEFNAREARNNLLAESQSWAKSFPLCDMAKKGWIPNLSTMLEKTAELLAFFSISNPIAWKKYYLEQQLKVAFRISLTDTKDPYALSAWLRKGELQASELKAEAYSKEKFKNVLLDVKTLMAKHPENFFKKLQTICANAGVKIVYTPCLPKAPISGSTRWLNNTPLIQLSGRYKRNDSFWFTFFHEAGHIILHGKKDIFLESIEYSDKDKRMENEADEFAIQWTLTKNEENEILELRTITVDDIIKFSNKFNTHPAIIIGRLQHDGHIPYSLGRQFLETIKFE